MLRIHFTEVDLARVRVAGEPDPMWEVLSTLHRLQSRGGRWQYAAWHRATRAELHAAGLARPVRRMLFALYPLGPYLPDFLTPAAAEDGLTAGLDDILRLPRRDVLAELRLLDRVRAVPPWALRLVQDAERREFTELIRRYHAVAVAPYTEHMVGGIVAHRGLLGRALLARGVEGLLSSLGPRVRWRRPVLEVEYRTDRDLYLRGRGIRIVPTWFSWGTPVALADAGLPPTLSYPLTRPAVPEAELPEAGVPLRALLGSTRARVLRCVADGLTTGELAQAAGISLSAASRHATVLRDAGLTTSQQIGPMVLHTLTPLGAGLLRQVREAAGLPGRPRGPGVS
ncbi:winged helix-turn-helix domain-containing protein [Streptomyces sp. SID13726]|uniref:helix-turn-helix domain-containing protein n=1 Tax=Streptomyces sp. SID13726 TaxID=2706058 RepID=UPI0013B774F9|nr:winged helix-turn-helix transcriptional regulator [Streptomyces sp. SID13726]